MGSSVSVPSILFVCTGNQYRSPIAAACLRRLLAQRGIQGWIVQSAGTWTGPQSSLLKDAAEASRELGFDLGDHRTRPVDRALLDRSDLILVMEQGHKEAVLTEFPEAGPRTHLLSAMVEAFPFDIPDPLAMPRERVGILREMCEMIERGLPRIMQLATAGSGRRP